MLLSASSSWIVSTISWAGGCLIPTWTWRTAITSDTTNSSDPSLLTNVALDFRSQFRWELSYFRNVKQKRGLHRTDNEIGRDPMSSPHVNWIASSNLLFNVAFINSLKKMNPIGVITDPALGNIWDHRNSSWNHFHTIAAGGRSLPSSFSI